jgi:hypothetical protein
MSFLHHLFANFSRNHEKAVSVFNSLLNQTENQENFPVKPLLLNQIASFGETPFVMAIEH